ncbi:hypothetical protein FNW25_02710 [Flavobacterium franklandianum]|uniref:Uncharacterized protein n=1 Tax=Flavobacterium franklandianum TaxID=2594430 RepID=A0A553CJ93_9FLAO|nr:hypothetical protein [Flavobacterium franklandianum]TRX20576.1 hypothetical protein FNW17_10690 [Flavobacterium franklandianum]TRX29428.1 hypothetical protein FNW25_02710 [Flavobacterium franklandianum]
MINKKFYLVVYVFLLIVYTRFFEFRPAETLFIRSTVLVFFVLLAFTIRRLTYEKGHFIKPIKLIIFSFFLAIIPSALFWSQDIFQSLVAIAPYSYFLLFLFLIEARINKDVIIKTLLVLAYVGLILFLYQFFFTTTVLFGGKEEFLEDRGVIRILFPGEGFTFFALFYYLNKLSKKFKLKHLLLLLPFLVMMLMQVTRIYILAFGLIAIYHFMIKSKVKYRIGGIIIFLVCYLYYNNTENAIVKGIRDATENDVEQKEDYIRLIEAEYFLYEFSNHTTTYLLGNGAYNYNSSYGKKILSLNENEHFFLEDIGIVKGYILFGILFVFGYILIFIKSFTIKIPHNQLYLKYYIWMILILSFTTRANTSAGFGVVLVSVLYLFELAYLEQNNLIETKSTGMLKRNFKQYSPSKT